MMRDACHATYICNTDHMHQQHIRSQSGSESMCLDVSEQFSTSNLHRRKWMFRQADHRSSTVQDTKSLVHLSVQVVRTLGC